MHALRKRRVREHVIADLSVNHVEYHALKAGCSVEVFRHDYGIDLTVATYDRRGQLEPGYLLLQLKATDRPRLTRGGKAFGQWVAKKDLRAWMREPMPVILVLYDARHEKAYWLYIQQYFEERPISEFAAIRNGTTIHVPLKNVVSSATFKTFADFRSRLLGQVQGVIHHA